MAQDWHGYFVVERQNIGDVNWASLKTLFEVMGEHASNFPAYNNHKRTRLDNDAVIYESLFDTTEVTLEAFKQLLADTFSVDVNDIESQTSITDYAGYGTTVWQFIYPVAGLDRFKIERFGAGSLWEDSRKECIGYLKANSAVWEPPT